MCYQNGAALLQAQVSPWITICGVGVVRAVFVICWCVCQVVLSFLRFAQIS